MSTTVHIYSNIHINAAVTLIQRHTVHFCRISIANSKTKYST